jgi:hypothetical protein
MTKHKQQELGDDGEGQSNDPENVLEGLTRP